MDDPLNDLCYRGPRALNTLAMFISVPMEGRSHGVVSETLHTRGSRHKLVLLGTLILAFAAFYPRRGEKG